jgi:hypothetical protein
MRHTVPGFERGGVDLAAHGAAGAVCSGAKIVEPVSGLSIAHAT